jgi:hypothetical protein
MQLTPAEIGPLSPRQRLRRLDRRTRVGKFLIATERALIEHLGGPDHVTTPQRILIERVASDLLRLEMFDEKVSAGTSFTDHDARVFHALRNSVRLALRDLGFDKADAPPAQTLSGYLASKAQAQP